jgi:hypothetical protein
MVFIASSNQSGSASSAISSMAPKNLTEFGFGLPIARNFPALFVDGLPPVAGNVPLTTIENQSVSLTTSQILAYAYDPNGDSLTLSAVGAASTNGGTIVFNGDTVTYTPVTNYTGADSFTYTVTDTNGGTATGNVLVSVECSTNNSTTMLPPTLLPGGSYQINFTGMPNCPYGMQRATVLTGPWTNLGTVTVSGAGIGQFVDANPPPSTAFYRTVLPP